METERDAKMGVPKRSQLSPSRGSLSTSSVTQRDSRALELLPMETARHKGERQEIPRKDDETNIRRYSNEKHNR